MWALNDDIDYDYDYVTYLRPTFIDRVDGDRDINMERLRGLIENELNK